MMRMSGGRGSTWSVCMWHNYGVWQTRGKMYTIIMIPYVDLLVNPFLIIMLGVNKFIVQCMTQKRIMIITVNHYALMYISVFFVNWCKCFISIVNSQCNHEVHWGGLISWNFISDITNINVIIQFASTMLYCVDLHSSWCNTSIFICSYYDILTLYQVDITSLLGYGIVVVWRRKKWKFYYLVRIIRGI